MIWRLFRRAPVLLCALCVAAWVILTAAAAPTSSLSLSSILSPLAVIAGSAVGTFVIAVGLDDLAGILVALKQKKFDWNKLPSFLESQFGTRQAAALFGLVIAAVTTAVGSVLIHGGLTASSLQALADAAFAAASAGAAAMLLSVLADLFAKISQLTGSPVPAPAIKAAPKTP